MRVNAHMKNSSRVNVKVAVSQTDVVVQRLMRAVVIAFIVLAVVAIVELQVAAFLALTY